MYDWNQLKLSTQHKYVYMYQKKIEMENSFLFIFDEIWPKIVYYSTGSLTQTFVHIPAT